MCFAMGPAGPGSRRYGRETRSGGSQRRRETIQLKRARPGFEPGVELICSQPRSHSATLAGIQLWNPLYHYAPLCPLCSSFGNSFHLSRVRTECGKPSGRSSPEKRQDSSCGALDPGSHRSGRHVDKALQPSAAQSLRSSRLSSRQTWQTSPLSSSPRRAAGGKRPGRLRQGGPDADAVAGTS